MCVCVCVHVCVEIEWRDVSRYQTVSGGDLSQVAKVMGGEASNTPQLRVKGSTFISSFVLIRTKSLTIVAWESLNLME